MAVGSLHLLLVLVVEVLPDAVLHVHGFAGTSYDPTHTALAHILVHMENGDSCIGGDIKKGSFAGVAGQVVPVPVLAEISGC